jgi:vibriolysin
MKYEHLVIASCVMVAMAAWQNSVSAQTFQMFEGTSSREAHPEVHVTVPSGFKLVGGGARVNWQGAGNLLTASFPDGDTWIARSKDHDISDPSTITGFAIGLQDPFDQWEVRVFQSTGSPAQHPRASVDVDNGYVMTGGGGVVHWTGDGNLMTASFPSSNRSWEVRSKDHMHPSPANITAFAIGIRPRTGTALPSSIILSSTTPPQAHPGAFVNVNTPNFTVTGGGALDDWKGNGNLLTATFPLPGLNGWQAAGKDHEVPDPAALTVFAIAIGR